jgi:DNA-binding CsgD family transcriptional regulator
MLVNSDLRSVIGVLGAVAESARDFGSFAEAGVHLLPKLVASEMTTLSVCDLQSGRREVVAWPDGRLGADDRASFDRHFAEHPLVRYHAARGRGAHRISDSIPFARFRHSALHAEYYRRVGLDHAIALPLFVDAGTLVSFVLNRKRRDFSDRDRAILDLTGATLAGLFATVGAVGRGGASAHVAGSLTAREGQVLHWLRAGKTDRDVAAILGCSHRTVQKHLQHIYEKLGVETRTAAAMRSLGPAPH